MTGFRNKKRANPFVQIDKNILSDDGISWKAKGILIYLLSKPDDWVTYQTDIEKRSTDGRDSVRSGIKELIDAGYMERIRVREKGRFKGWEYSVYEYPQITESTENGFSEVGKTDEKGTENGFSENGKSENGKTDYGETVTSNNNLSNNNLSNNNYYNDNQVGQQNEVDEKNEKVINENPFTFFEQNGFGALGKHIGDKIGSWIDDVGEELVLQAMKIAVENSAINWNYVETILRDWSSKKFTSLADYEAHELKREQERSRKKKQVGGRRYGAPAKEEIVPEWFNREESKEPEVEEKPSKDDIEERRRKLQEELKQMRNNGVRTAKKGGLR